ncbi:MAG: NAD(P)H-dependent oxidoreductase subunit E [Candidatus Omnitrophica bacterium]|jgi:NADH-quinone oxidoreductase subunit E|nr:NAD(P)H-dependent oxidoreductase subunit E [Candidatus Omnitrophota bacterium]MDD3987585.1 NAD(P)H-dependent oxidoreductase subunit E [Candidatus Omnitrophota bacterium]MDD4981440.1 NAD(P)H-dependent oxidoreductase subunit E [Candidatus Omnitrophota bacterium]MDD5665264.1 NAD(P)H-dependent oxidoreductase subunit E [Candidatus Omnitrophota bacterium]
MTKELDKIILRYKGKPGMLLGVIEEAQKLNPHKYLTKEVLEYIAKQTKVPVSKIYNIITFYAFFNLKPQGKHSIIVCRGTACHTRGSKNLLDFLIRYFGLNNGIEGQQSSLTTQDKKFTIKTVACFGQCALAPVVEVDGNIYSRVTEEKLKKIIKELLKKRK